MIRNSSAQAQWRGGLAPGHERRDGELVVGGVRAGELAAAYGTPLLAIDYNEEGTIDIEARSWLGERWADLLPVRSGVELLDVPTGRRRLRLRGSGRDLRLRRRHHQEPRRARPRRARAALVERQAAFTPAAQDRPGKIRAADDHGRSRRA